METAEIGKASACRETHHRSLVPAEDAGIEGGVAGRCRVRGEVAIDEPYRLPGLDLDLGRREGELHDGQ